MWDPTSRSLTRSWREGKGPTAQTDDYAFLIQGKSPHLVSADRIDNYDIGLLDLYNVSGDEEHVIWAIELQKRQDELFWDEVGGGYYASAPDEHVLVRMKDSQVRHLASWCRDESAERE
jgi:uncharacterized protein YyaL (SSP411 family)